MVNLAVLGGFRLCFVGEHWWELVAEGQEDLALGFGRSSGALSVMVGLLLIFLGLYQCRFFFFFFLTRSSEMIFVFSGVFPASGSSAMW